MKTLPDFTKFKKYHKGKIAKQENYINNKKFRYLRTFLGIIAMGSGRVTGKQIETIRLILSKRLKKRKGFYRIRLFSDIPVTQKPTESRMGKGKGAIKFWAMRVAAGKVLVECGGKSSLINIIKVLRQVQSKFSFETKLINLNFIVSKSRNRYSRIKYKI